ncbi:MAG: RNA methyltransferase, partial [Bacteroidetes bacterium CG02_land_8_20_14_3_00_31_25]
IEDIYAFNKSIGNKLKNSYSGFKAGIILMKNDEAKSIGLKSSKKITIFNGPIECLYLEYELYHGSHKKSVEKTI